MKHTIWMARALVALAFLWTLSGCSSRPAAHEPPPEPFAAVAPTATLRPPGTPLRMVGHFWSEAQRPQMEALLARYTAESGIPVLYEGAEKVPELLLAELEGGTVPDVLLLPVPNWLHELAAAQAIPPLSDEAAQAVRAHYGDAWVELVSDNGEIYGVPFDAQAKSLLWISPAAVEQPPDSLDDLEALAAARAASGEATFALPGQIGWTLTDAWENVLLATAGADSYDALLAHRIAWDDPQVVAAAEAFVGLLRDEWLLDGAAGAVEMPLWAQSFDEALDPNDPQAAIWLGPGSVIAESTLRAGEDFDVLPFPANGGVIGVGSVAVATNDHPDTMALLHFLAQPRAVEPWVREGGFTSPNRDLPLDAYPTELARRQAELLVSATLFRYDLSDRLPPNLGGPFLWGKLREMLLHPEQVERILADIEAVATREQGRPAGR